MGQAIIKLKYSNNRRYTEHDRLQNQKLSTFEQTSIVNSLKVSVLHKVIDEKLLAERKPSYKHYHDKEVLTYVKSGILEQEDEYGNVHVVHNDEFQLISSGSCLQYSEHNPSGPEPTELIQFIIQPDVLGVEYRIQSELYSNKDNAQLIASPNGVNNSYRINQDVSIHKLNFCDDQSVSFFVDSGRTVYAHVISGVVSVNSGLLYEGDSAILTNDNMLDMTAFECSSVFIVDLPSV